MIRDHEDAAWRASCVLYRRLTVYNEVVQRRAIHVWWTFVKYNSGAFKRTSSVMAILCGSQPKGMGKNFTRNPRCQICDAYALEDFEHTLFVCDSLSDMRQRLFSRLIESMPLSMQTDLLNMSHRNKLRYLLSGFSMEHYVPEWQDIYLKTSTFMYEMYRARAAEYKRLENVDI